MDLTHSYKDVVPADVLARFSFAEVRNAATTIKHSDSILFDEIMDVLRGITFNGETLIRPGKNKHVIARMIDESFREAGWREGKVDIKYTSTLTLSPYRPAGEKTKKAVETEVTSEGYKVDNLKNRIALDGEWNAKDGNLDRDMSAYRTLYDLGFIDGAVLITRLGEEMVKLAYEIAKVLERGDDWKSGLDTTTTTNLGKLQHRLTRGDAGGCPLLVIAISPATWDGTYGNEPVEEGIVS